MIFIMRSRPWRVFLLYVDDSGQTRINRTRRDNGLYVLGGTIVYETRWKSIEADLERMKKDLFPMFDPEKWELHAHDIWNNTSFLPDKKMRINYAQKQRIFSEVVGIACRSEAAFVGAVISKDKLLEGSAVPRPMVHAWTMLTDQFEHFLRRQPEGANTGLLCVDASNKSTECAIRNLIHKLVKNGTPFQSVDHIMGNPVFIESHMSGMMQLTDMIAYVIHRNHRGDRQFKAWLEDLLPKTYCPNGGMAKRGIKTFP